MFSSKDVGTKKGKEEDKAKIDSPRGGSKREDKELKKSKEKEGKLTKKQVKQARKQSLEDLKKMREEDKQHGVVLEETRPEQQVIRKVLTICLR